MDCGGVAGESKAIARSPDNPNVGSASSHIHATPKRIYFPLRHSSMSSETENIARIIEKDNMKGSSASNVMM